MTKRDWDKLKFSGKRKTSISDEKDRFKGDRAARWLDKVEGKKKPAKPTKGGRS